MSTTGSGLLNTSAPAKEHLTRGSGVGGEVADLRADLKAAMKHMASIVVEEWTNPAATAVAGLHAATPTVAAPVTLLASALVAAGKTALATHPRTITFTTAGGTAADAPANVVITGTDVNDKPLTETLVLAQTAATVESVKAYKTITSLAFPAADGTGATVAVGLGTKLGLKKKVKSRAGLAAPIQEIAIGAVVTTGTITDAATSAPNGLYVPAANPNDTNDYCIFYEADES